MRIVVMSLLVALTVSVSAFAAGDDPVEPRNPDYAKGVEAVKAQDYRTAIGLFEKVAAAEPKNADAFNYLGFSHRKLGEMDAALQHYYKALSINPDHRGANEYIGQAYLTLGELAKAKDALAKLDKICWLGCSEFTSLKNAIRDYEAKTKK